MHLQRRATVVLQSSNDQQSTSKATSSTSPEFLDLSALIEERRPLIEGLLKGFPSKALKLFVAVSPLLGESDYKRIAPILWESSLIGDVDAASTASVCQIHQTLLSQWYLTTIYRHVSFLCNAQRRHPLIHWHSLRSSCAGEISSNPSTARKLNYWILKLG